MTTYTRPLVNGTPTTGQVVKAGHVNEPIDQIYDTILAGGITSDQIAAGAVDTSELATAAVTAAKMDGTLPDASAMATSAAPTTDAQLANKKYVDDQIHLGNILGQARAIAYWDADGAENITFNASVAKNASAGDFTVSWTTPFSSADYVVVVTPFNASAKNISAQITTIAAGSVRVRMTDNSNNATAAGGFIIAFGAQ